jgi:hypothetical protein
MSFLWTFLTLHYYKDSDNSVEGEDPDDKEEGYKLVKYMEKKATTGLFGGLLAC